MARRKSYATLGLLTLALAAPARASGDRAVNSGAAAESAQRTSNIPHRTAFGSRSEEQTYAAREAASPDAKKFRGGDVIVISVTTAVIIVLIVVLLIVIL